jgi:hypothetical protein
MPPDVREWLPPRHLAWFVIDAVAEMELDAFMRLSGRRALPAALWPGDDGLSSTGRRNAVWPVTLKRGSDELTFWVTAAVVVEARPEGGPERR